MRQVRLQQKNEKGYVLVVGSLASSYPREGTNKKLEFSCSTLAEPGGVQQQRRPGELIKGLFVLPICSRLDISIVMGYYGQPFYVGFRCFPLHVFWWPAWHCA